MSEGMFPEIQAIIHGTHLRQKIVRIGKAVGIPNKRTGIRLGLPARLDAPDIARHVGIANATG